MTTLADVKAKQPEWFSRKNKRFFGDVSYKVLHSKVTHKPYLVRSTYQWSDMFDQAKTLRYRVNELKEDLSIGPLLDKQFRDLDAVKEWLRTV
jgi:hypothetical protein